MFGKVHSILVFLTWPIGWGPLARTLWLLTWEVLTEIWRFLVMCLKVSARCHCWVWILIYLGWENCELRSFQFDSDTDRSAIWQHGTLCSWGWRQFGVKALLVTLENMSLLASRLMQDHTSQDHLCRVIIRFPVWNLEPNQTMFMSYNNY